MLVLTRRQGEEIMIGHDICVRVTALMGDRVRIGITAPPHVRIDRREVHDRREAQAAAAPVFVALTPASREAQPWCQDG
jgi:carbon storage regulator